MGVPVAKVFCPCSESVPLVVRDAAELELSTFPSTIDDPHTWHLLGFLNFCEQCQAVKCRKCIELEVITKFCPRCMHEMKPEHSFCSRNCFDCPICSSNIYITQKSSSEGKEFHFKCTMCEYTYNTPIQDKPRPLSRVVRNEINELPPIKMFSDLEKYYIQTKQLREGKIDIPKAILKQVAEMRIKDNDVPEFIRRSTIKKFEPASDLELSRQRQQASSNNDTIPLDIALGHAVPQFTKASHPLPISTKLTAKHSKRCKACRTSLMKPDIDPTSVKFYKLSNAIDHLPTISIYQNPTKLSSVSKNISMDYMLSFKNPLDKESEITLSTPSIQQHKVHLPVTKFKLGSKPENSLKLEVLAKTTPSIELSRLTKLGRIELMSRAPPNYETKEGIYEKNFNFCVIPMSITISDTFKQGDLVTVPVLISVRSEGIACGYWVVLEIGEMD